MDPLPVLPIDFTALVQQIIPLLWNVVASIAPYVVIYGIFWCGLQWMAGAFNGNTSIVSSGHSVALYNFYKEKLELDENADVPDWVHDQLEEDQIYDNLKAKERYKTLEQRAKERIKQENEYNPFASFGNKLVTSEDDSMDNSTIFSDVIECPDCFAYVESDVIEGNDMCCPECDYEFDDDDLE